MVVDDSLVIRGLITRILKEAAAVDVIASVSDGQKAVDRARRGDVDVVILDIEMPVLDGLGALPQLLALDRDLVVIMASTLTMRNADVSLKALRAGATDYVPKPSTTTGIYSAVEFRTELLSKVIALGGKRLEARGITLAQDIQPVRAQAKFALKPFFGDVPLRALAVGSSTGGPRALEAFFQAVPPTINIPVVITQHMPPTFTRLLAEQLSRDTGWVVQEAVDGDEMLPGRALLAPGDFHMRAVRDGVAVRVKLDQREKENFCRPSVDPMLSSLIPIYGSHIAAVILTGMGQDGLKGAQLLAASGGTVLAQDEDSSVVWGMPGAVAMAGLCSAVMPIADLARLVTDMANGKTP
jgi:two-component system chemotaxis response regulator CheB